MKKVIEAERRNIFRPLGRFDELKFFPKPKSISTCIFSYSGGEANIYSLSKFFTELKCLSDRITKIFSRFIERRIKDLTVKERFPACHGAASKECGQRDFEMVQIPFDKCAVIQSVECEGGDVDDNVELYSEGGDDENEKEGDDHYSFIYLLNVQDPSNCVSVSEHYVFHIEMTGVKVWTDSRIR